MNIDANVVIQKLTRQISDLVLQVAILQTQVEMLMQKSAQQDNKPTTQSETEHNAENMSE